MLYAIRKDHKGNTIIYEVEPIKYSRRGTAVWCRFNNYKKLKLVSLTRLYNTYQEAKEELN